MEVPATKPYFSDEDIGHILSDFDKILRGDSFLSMHKYGEMFENNFAEFIGTRYAVSCNSGTSALELIFRSLEVEGGEVILPSNTFLATAIAIKNAGAKLVFADCGNDMCIDLDDAISKVNSKTKAICIVHIGGIVSRGILQLRDFCEKHDIHLVEDAAQAHGSSLEGTRAGAFGVASGFSFFSTKVMTTGEGGMVTTDSKELVNKMKSMREFGKVRSDIYINYHKYFGYNWRMPEVAALLGLRQLKALPNFIKRRQEIAKIYDSRIHGNKNVKIIEPSCKDDHNYFKYAVLITNQDRALVHQELVKKGISPSGYIYEYPLHKQPVLKEFNNLELENTEKICGRHLCLPIFYGMTDEQAYYVADCLEEVVG